MQVELWLFPLDHREPEPVKMGGEPMDRGRALFRALLPPGDETYTAAAIVRRYYPRDMRKKTHPTLWREYEVQHRALNRLMRDSIHYANPDNADPETGELPDGKFQGKQARAWTRQTWLKLLSDDVYEWLAALRADIERRLGLGRVRIFLDLRTFEISEVMCQEIPVVVSAALCPFVVWRLQVNEDLNKQHAEQLAYEAFKARNQVPPPPQVVAARSYAPRVFAGAIAAALIIGFILWPRQSLIEDDIFPEYTSTAPPANELPSLTGAEYMARRRSSDFWSFDDPPVPDEMVAQQWQGGPKFEAVAMQPPPLLDIVSRYHLPTALGQL